MLRYYANGFIQLKRPLRCNTRTNWEFYAVVEGRCAPMFRDDDAPPLQEKTLWVFAPECSHAWIDERNHPYRRIALHFGSVPYPLDGIVREKGWIERRLTSADVGQLERIAADLEPHFLRPHTLSHLHFQARLNDLAALVLQSDDPACPPALPELGNFKVESALAWYAEHLERSPSVKEVAAAVHTSTSHLRRLFWQIRRTSPKNAFQRIRLEKAQELMSRTALTLEEVSRRCGYASASHFCREYQARHHFTPTYWRKKLIDRFSTPPPEGAVFTREHSARPEERTMPA